MSSTSNERLIQKWSQLAMRHSWDPAAAQAAREELFDHYGQAGRHYHNLEHIDDCLHQASLLALAGAEADALEMAIWFHDAIYEIGRSDNEKASARFAQTWLAKLGKAESTLRLVMRLIEVTDHPSTPANELEELMLDIDLSILGREPSQYDLYAEKIRREYGSVSESLYRAGRSNVLRHFLERPRLYHTQMFWEKYENRARENLFRELSGLNGCAS